MPLMSTYISSKHEAQKSQIQWHTKMPRNFKLDYSEDKRILVKVTQNARTMRFRAMKCAPSKFFPLKISSFGTNSSETHTILISKKPLFFASTVVMSENDRARDWTQITRFEIENTTPQRTWISCSIPSYQSLVHRLRRNSSPTSPDTHQVRLTWS